MIQPPRRSPSYRSLRSSRCAWPSWAASRWRCSRSSSSACGSSRCCRATSTWPRRARTGSRHLDPGSARGDPRPAAGTSSSTACPRPRFRSRRPDLPGRRRASAGGCTAGWHRCWGCRTSERRCPVNGSRGAAPDADRLPHRPGRGAAALRERDDQDRLSRRCPLLPGRAPGRVPGGERPAGVAALAIPLHNAGRAAVRDGGADHRAPRVHDPRFRGVSQNDVVGQSGLEWYYDRYLQGVDGADRVQVNALGQFNGYLSEHKPIPGHNLKLSLEPRSSEGRAAGAAGVDRHQPPPAPAGAFVAMNPTNGAIYAMGSLPTFDPNIVRQAGLAVGLRPAQQRLERLSAVQPGDPERLPDRLDLQGHHRDRGAAERRLEPRRRVRRHRRVLRRTGRATCATTPATPPTECSTSPRRSRSPRTTSSTTSAAC